MKVNEGTLDRTLRMIAGLALLGLAATGRSAGGATSVWFRC